MMGKLPGLRQMMISYFIPNLCYKTNIMVFEVKIQCTIQGIYWLKINYDTCILTNIFQSCI